MKLNIMKLITLILLVVVWNSVRLLLDLPLLVYYVGCFLLGFFNSPMEAKKVENEDGK